MMLKCLVLTTLSTTPAFSFETESAQAVVATAAVDSLQNCANRVLTGRYAYQIQGTVFDPPPVIQAVFVGVVEFDGQGALRGSDFGSFSGQVVPRTFNGTYSVNPDCTGSATLNILTGFPVGATFHLSIVLIDRGKSALFIQTDPGTQFTGSATKQ
jgi:hypothetical protein